MLSMALVLLLATIAAIDRGAAASSPAVAQACSCSDGRTFATGAAIFGRASTRVVVTGMETADADATTNGIPLCRNLRVIAQTIKRRDGADGHAYLWRETARRGTIRDICDSTIQFVERLDTYDPFKNDLPAAIDEDSLEPPPLPIDDKRADAGPPVAEDAGGDLVGKDLRRLIPSIPERDAEPEEPEPDDDPFDNRALKEGAYIVTKVRLRVQRASEDNAPVRPGIYTLPPQTLGVLLKRTHSRSAPFWIAEVWPDSRPQTFWQRLFFAHTRAARLRVSLPQEYLVEINTFLDGAGREATRFAEQRRQLPPDAPPFHLLYVAPRLPLAANLALAREHNAIDRIADALTHIAIRPTAADLPTRRQPIVLDPDAQRPPAEAAPDYLRPQCFLTGDRAVWTADPTRAPLMVRSSDVRILQPRDTAKVPRDYYAIDIELQLDQPADPAASIVCRFPWATIDLALVDMTKRLLSSWFDLQRLETR
jgi:hypothetical protein